jgi:glycerophosphoryl diester phosphodiesterase
LSLFGKGLNVMIVLSHRGLWKNKQEKNTEIAFRQSFESGFGTETDVRDYCGELVISHDIANSSCMSFGDFLKIYNSYSTKLPLALNIKADGLQEKLLLELNKYGISNYFVFDMSVPDGLACLKAGLRTFTRQSEYEPHPAFYESAQGVWIDEFTRHWVDDVTIINHITNDKKICIVSPELHKRPMQKEWQHYKEICSNFDVGKNIMLCTDLPEEAERIFNGN